LTSLAPSPIASVTLEGNLFLIKLTISAFYWGETLQARTTSTLSEASKNLVKSSIFEASTVRVSPATTIACFLPALFGKAISY
tara:strand:+ start:346 stop:594 length:249 start_codon:yes stop_codon:yes gene_type:complete